MGDTLWRGLPVVSPSAGRSRLAENSSQTTKFSGTGGDLAPGIGVAVTERCRGSACSKERWCVASYFGNYLTAVMRR